MSQLPNNQKASLTELFITAVFTLSCFAGAALCLSASYYIASIIIGLFGLLSGWSFIESFRAGLRHPADVFEKFEQRLFIRAIAVVATGGLLVFAVWRFAALGSTAIKTAIILLAVIIWLGASFFAARKLRGKNETAAAYKRRIRYTEKEK
jgi:hypothetical protein